MNQNEFRNARISLYILAFILLFTVAFYFFASMFTSMGYETFLEAKTASTAAKYTKTLIIDAGHGGEDPGAVSNGTIEKNINLSISLYLSQLCKAGGIDVKMTRSNDVLLYGAGEENRKKHFDLLNRVKIAQSFGENTLFVSIHTNKFTDAKYWGLQTFFSKNNAYSSLLAEAVQSSSKLLTPENKREIKMADDSIFLLDKLYVPAILVECGFLSNPEEAAKLNDPQYQKQIALSIYCGIVEYLEGTKNEN